MKRCRRNCFRYFTALKKILEQRFFLCHKTFRPRPLLCKAESSAAQFYAELEKGYKQIEEGKGIPVEVVFTELRTRYGL